MVPPRDYLVFERFLAVGDRGDAASAVDLALELRQALRGEKYVTLRGTVNRRAPPREHQEYELSVFISEGELAADKSTRTPWSR
ncbi:hypothetical protein ACN28S_34805 [Cystobacter fuscus]